MFVWVVCCCFIFCGFAAGTLGGSLRCYTGAHLPRTEHLLVFQRRLRIVLEARSSFEVRTNVKVSLECGFIRRIVNLTGVWRERSQAHSSVFNIQQVVLRLDEHLLPFLLFRRWYLIEVQTSLKKKIKKKFFLVFLFSVYKSEIQQKKRRMLETTTIKKKCAEFFFFNLQISKFFPVIIIQCGFLCCFILLEVDLHKTKMFWVFVFSVFSK